MSFPWVSDGVPSFTDFALNNLTTFVGLSRDEIDVGDCYNFGKLFDLLEEDIHRLKRTKARGRKVDSVSEWYKSLMMRTFADEPQLAAVMRQLPGEFVRSTDVFDGQDAQNQRRMVRELLPDLLEDLLALPTGFAAADVMRVWYVFENEWIKEAQRVQRVEAEDEMETERSGGKRIARSATKSVRRLPWQTP